MKLLILSLALAANGRDLIITYTAPTAGRVFVDASCDLRAWQSGWVNVLAVSGTNTVTVARPCASAGFFKLRQ